MKVAWWGGLVVILAVAGGLLLYNVTSPEGDVVPTGTPSWRDDSQPDSQFLQLRPSSAPPVDGGQAASDEGGLLPGVGRPPGADSGAGTGAGSTKTAETVATISVSMTDSGFVPDEIAVSLGTKVTFVNDGQALHWPASDDHPTHTRLPGFDAGRGLATGEEYSFVFDELGAWQYHDHLMPDVKGAVVVK